MCGCYSQNYKRVGAEGAKGSSCTEFGNGAQDRDQKRVPEPSLDVVAGVNES